MLTAQYTYKLSIAYDGTNYCGWQVQPNGVSIQEVIQKALFVALRQEITIIASGRTDAGVHALEQIAHFHSDKQIDLYRLRGSLNALLPPDIRITDIVAVPAHFHAQYSPISKVYHYHLHLNRVEDPFYRLYRWHIKEKIDTNILREGTKIFIGTHDFTSFANQAHLGSASRDPVRTLSRLDAVDQPGGMRLEFEANGFLYKMVRNIVGTLVETAAGKHSLEDLRHMLAAKDRKKAGNAAPSNGLFLVNVNYGDGFQQ
ncbi:MAG: tRNA pseudouridine(38-40) synthase TruA [Parachlamydiaceae bacterium]